MRPVKFAAPALLALALAACGGEADAPEADDQATEAGEDAAAPAEPGQSQIRFEDMSHRVSPADTAALEGKLAEVAAAGHDIRLVVLDSTGNQDHNAYAANELAQRGGEALILVAMMDQSIGVAGAGIDEAFASEIEQLMGDRFDANDFMGGFNAGIDAVAAHLGG